MTVPVVHLTKKEKERVEELRLHINSTKDEIARLDAVKNTAQLSIDEVLHRAALRNFDYQLEFNKAPWNMRHISNKNPYMPVLSDDGSLVVIVSGKAMGKI